MSNYIAVDLKVIEVLAPMVARAANITEDRALAGLVRLWHRCWSTTSDTLTLSQLAGVFGGDRIAEVAEVLCSDFLEHTTDGYRARGAGRYLRLKASRREGALKTNALRASTSARSKSVGERTLPDALSPSTEHRAPNTEQKTLAGFADATPPKAKSKAPKVEKASDPRHTPLTKAMTETFAAIKGVKYPYDGRDAKAVTNLLAKEPDPAAIERAWARALREATHPPIACIYELVPKLAHFVGTGPPAALDLRRPVAPATFTESRTVENF